MTTPAEQIAVTEEELRAWENRDEIITTPDGLRLIAEIRRLTSDLAHEREQTAALSLALASLQVVLAETEKESVRRGERVEAMEGALRWIQVNTDPADGEPLQFWSMLEAAHARATSALAPATPMPDFIRGLVREYAAANEPDQGGASAGYAKLQIHPGPPSAGQPAEGEQAPAPQPEGPIMPNEDLVLRVAAAIGAVDTYGADAQWDSSIYREMAREAIHALNGQPAAGGVTDTERIDWMERCLRTRVNIFVTVNAAGCFGFHVGDDLGHHEMGLREAIDAARGERDGD